jgi:hypothetical protein
MVFKGVGKSVNRRSDLHFVATDSGGERFI